MEWVAYCTACGELDRAPNGPMMESTARLHRRDTGHMTLVGYEPSILMSGEMKEIDIGQKENIAVYVWQIHNPATGEITSTQDEFISPRDAFNDATAYADKDITSPVPSEGLEIKVADSTTGVIYISRFYVPSWAVGSSTPGSGKPVHKTVYEWGALAGRIKDAAGDLNVSTSVNLALATIYGYEPGFAEAKRELTDLARMYGVN